MTETIHATPALSALSAWAAARPTTDSIARWQASPLPELVEHLVGRYHEDLRAHLPRLVEMSAAVDEAHAASARHRPELTPHLSKMKADLLVHLAKEEQILFPMIAAGRGALARAPISVMFREHEDHERDLLHLEALLEEGLPQDACETWRALHADLAILVRELRVHVTLENEILFRRALMAA